MIYHKIILIRLCNIWTVLSLLFLLFMILGHAFGNELQVFQSKKELIAFLFFPLGLILGLFIGLPDKLLGGGISFICFIVILCLVPNIIYSPYHWLIISPGLLSFLTGIIYWRSKI